MSPFRAEGSVVKVTQPTEYSKQRRIISDRKSSVELLTMAFNSVGFSQRSYPEKNACLGFKARKGAWLLLRSSIQYDTIQNSPTGRAIYRDGHSAQDVGYVFCFDLAEKLNSYSYSHYYYSYYSNSYY